MEHQVSSLVRATAVVFFVRGPFDVLRVRASYFHIRVRVSALVRLIQERYGIDSKLTRHLPFFSFLFFSFSRSLFQQHEVEFGNGILNKGKKNVKREKRQPTQIEIMAAVEREKQAKKAERRAAKVRAHMRRPLCLFFYFYFLVLHPIGSVADEDERGKKGEFFVSWRFG